MICQLGESLQETCKWFCPQGRLTPKVISLSWWTLTRFVSYFANLLKRDNSNLRLNQLYQPAGSLINKSKEILICANFLFVNFSLVTKLNFDTWERWIGELDRSEIGICCCSVAQSCPILCDYMDRSTPGFPVLHHLLELAQTHVHWVGDAINISSSVVPFSSRLQSFAAWASFLMSRLFISGG